MILHLTKNKGDLGVLKAQADLAEQGFMILHPLTEHAPFDLVAYKDKHFIRIQVKYRTLSLVGAISVNMKNNWVDKHGIHVKYLDKTQVDIICIYCPDTDKCYYIDPLKYNKSISLRVNAPKNNQKQGVILADDCRRVP